MVCIVVLCSISLASLIQGAVGFGYGLVATGLLASVVDIKDASVIMVLGGLCQNLTILRSHWTHVSCRGIAILALCAVVGVPIGVAFLTRSDPRWVVGGLGMLLIVATVRRCMTPASEARWPPIIAMPAGLLTGALHGAFGAGAPAAVLHLSRQGLERGRYVASLQIILGVSSLTRAACFGTYGLVNRELATLGLLGVIFAWAGARLGIQIHNRISNRRLEQATNALLLLLGLKYLLSVFAP